MDLFETALPEPHTRPAADVAARLDVDPARGLSEGEVTRRRAAVGANRLAEAPSEPRWKMFLAQFANVLIIVLLVAALVSLVVTRELATPLFIVFVVLFNATLGYVQESRAEASLEALRRMLVTRSRVIREGQVLEVDAEDLVPGDIVIVESGDKVGADGRILTAANLEAEESALTGESEPVPKNPEPVDDVDAPLGDRRCSMFMNTTVTRGRGEMVVTATGMDTQVGQLAGLLRETSPGPTPLQQQLDVLGRNLAIGAGIVVVLVFAITIARAGFANLDVLFLSAVSLAVAAIPEGLPAVVAFTLAVGTTRMARHGAIVKRLASVETLGGTSQICSDKTGTLTLNEMTAQQVRYALRRYTVSGTGYRTEGSVVAEGEDGDRTADSLEPLLTACLLCSDAVVRDGECVGDPTEGALVVLGHKAGLEADEVRRAHPRLAEVPFDSANKFMATFHDWPDAEGGVRCFVKGAPDVLLARSRAYVAAGGEVREFGLPDVEEFSRENAQLARSGLRVIAAAYRDVAAVGAEPVDQVDNLVLLGLVGISDPPRPEARAAIEECRSAGVTVRMITGDHVATARSVGEELGIPGQAVTGSEIDLMSDAELTDTLDDIGVFARVSPEHKIRVVRLLQSRDDVVAMTGDGVNDSPALKAADIGVAMGDSGTEVAKEAATMVLTDDNFATIVRAVREGRVIFDNILKFIRFQLSTSIGFVTTFLAAALFNIAGGHPFSPIQILFVNLIMDGPPALALGVDTPEADVMQRQPRPLKERILIPSRFAIIAYAAVIMAVGTLAVIVAAPGPGPSLTDPTVAGTMAFVTFVLFQVFNLLNSRSPRLSVFTVRSLDNRALWVSLVFVVVTLVVVVHWSWAQQLFLTMGLSGPQWALCALVASSILWLEEARKLVVRLRVRVR